MPRARGPTASTAGRGAASARRRAGRPCRVWLSAALERRSRADPRARARRRAGFRIDTLLKLADVKGTDRRTSLLHYVLAQLAAGEGAAAAASLVGQLAAVRGAANLQARRRVIYTAGAWAVWRAWGSQAGGKALYGTSACRARPAIDQRGDAGSARARRA